MLKNKMGSIGIGVPGVELRVVDDNGNTVKRGELGEIAVSGNNIMKGYFNDIEETNKVLKNGLLYTGDIATVDEDGYIYIAGRKKLFIKSGGYRISPKEIEEVIYKIPNVAEAVAIGIQDNLLGEAIKVYIVKSNNTIPMTEKDVIDYCHKVLPSYKTPKFVEFVNNLPKNSFGKILISELQCSKESM